MLFDNNLQMKDLPVDVVFVSSVGTWVGTSVVGSVGACVGATVVGSLSTKVW